MGRINISVNVMRQGSIKSEDYTKTINSYKHLLQIIKIDDIIRNTESTQYQKKRYELSQTSHANMTEIIDDINLIVTEIY